MSNRYSIRATGVAGGAFMTNPSANPSLIQSLLGYGIVSLVVDFGLNGGLPERHTSDDEPHWVFSFHDYFLKTEILSVGITPTGKIAIATPEGSLYLTEAGAIQTTGGRHSVRVEWDGGIGLGQAFIDGGPLITIGSGVSPSFAVPSTVGVICALNGGNAGSKFLASVYRIETTWFDSLSVLQQCVWEISEGTGDVTVATRSGASTMLDGFDMDLYRSWMIGYPSPWSVDSSGDPGEAVVWVLKTPYRRRTRAATRYRKRRVSWLS